MTRPDPSKFRARAVVALARVGRTHAGTAVTVAVEDHRFRVLHGETELTLQAINSTKPIRNFNASQPRKDKDVPTATRQ